MDELVKITERDGKKAVSARELYVYLGFNTTQWKRWYEKNIINNPYATENEDYVGFDIMSNGNETMDFALTLNFAKKISMQAKTQKGEDVRNYFIECERVSTQPAIVPAVPGLIDTLHSLTKVINSFADRLNKLEDNKTPLVQQMDLTPVPVPVGYGRITAKEIESAELRKKGLKYREISEILGVSPEVARGRIDRYNYKIARLGNPDTTPEPELATYTEPYYEVVNNIKYFSIPKFMKFHNIKSNAAPSKLGACASTFCDIHNMKVRTVKSKSYYPESVLKEVFAYYLPKDNTPVTVSSNITPAAPVSRKEPKKPAPVQYMTVNKYAKKLNLKLALPATGNISMRAKNLCKQRGIEVKKVSNGLFGAINAYPVNVLKEVFANLKTQPQ